METTNCGSIEKISKWDRKLNPENMDKYASIFKNMLVELRKRHMSNI